MFGMGFQEFAIVAIVAVLLFGKRLPEVARSFGQSYKQFRDGLSDIQRQMDVSEYTNPSLTYSNTDETSTPSSEDDYEQPTAPKFELPEENTSSDQG